MTTHYEFAYRGADMKTYMLYFSTNRPMITNAQNKVVRDEILKHNPQGFTILSMREVLRTPRRYPSMGRY